MSLIRASRTPINAQKGFGDPFMTAAEQRLMARSDRGFLYQPWLNWKEEGGCPDHLGVLATPVEAGVMPGVTEAGSEGNWEWRALTGFPSGVLMSPPGGVAASFTLDLIAAGNSNVFDQPIFGVVGDGGGVFGMTFRASNLFRVLSIADQNADAIGRTIHTDVSGVAINAFHHGIVSYDASLDQLKVWLKGTLRATVNSLVINLPTTRLSLFGAHDLQGFASGGARGARIQRAYSYKSAADDQMIADLIESAQTRFPTVYV